MRGPTHYSIRGHRDTHRTHTHVMDGQDTRVREVGGKEGGRVWGKLGRVGEKLEQALGECFGLPVVHSSLEQVFHPHYLFLMWS